jgi:hypothetical protein
MTGQMWRKEGRVCACFYFEQQPFRRAREACSLPALTEASTALKPTRPTLAKRVVLGAGLGLSLRLGAIQSQMHYIK